MAYRGLRARGTPGARRGRRSGGSCPRSTGNSAAPAPRSRPVNSGERWRLARMTSWLRGLVRVIAQNSCGIGPAVGQRRHRPWLGVGRLLSQPRPVDRAPVEPRRGAGLEPGHRQSWLRAVGRRGRCAEPSPIRPPLMRSSPRNSVPPRKVPVHRITAGAARRVPSARSSPWHRAAVQAQRGRFALRRASRSRLLARSGAGSPA